jgi:periplasmic protein TonB
MKSGRVVAAMCAAFIFQRAAAQQADSSAPPTATGQTIEVSGAYSPLVFTKMPRLKHPKEAKGVSGWVRVECLVAPNGRIQSVRVVESQPAGVFDQAAIDAMREVRFKPFGASEPRLMTQRLFFGTR